MDTFCWDQPVSSFITFKVAIEELAASHTCDEIHVVLGLIMLMGRVQKPTLKSYFSCDAFTEIPILPQTMKQGRFDLIKKFLYFVDNNTVSTNTGSKKK